MSGGRRLKLALHGPIVEIDCSVPALDSAIDALLGEFALATLPQGFVPATGIISPFEHDEVARRVPSTARHVRQLPDGADLFEDGDRHWMVDRRWGLTEINFSRNQFRSWVYAQPNLEAVRLAEISVLWPISQ